MPEPLAITKRKEADMRYAQLNRDVEENLRSKAVTTWFESAETKPGNNAKADTAAKEIMEADLRTASEELVKVRRERLRALYASDKLGWQAALAARGLAMET